MARGALPAQGCHARGFFLHAGFGAGEQQVEGFDGFGDVAAFVEHDAFGAFGLGGVGDFGAAWGALFDEVFEHLGGPDDGYVGGFADAEELFLRFGEALEAELDGEVSARDHDTEGLFCGGGDDDFGEVFDGAFGLDFCDESERVEGSAAGDDGGLQGLDVAAALDERVADEVGVLRCEGEVYAVFFGEGVECETGAGEVEPLFGFEFVAARFGAGDFEDDAFVGAGDDAAADASLVDGDVGADEQLGECFGDAALDDGDEVFCAV